MNAALTSITLNSSTAFQTSPAQLGWHAMPTFPAVNAEAEIALGWTAMPAFGQALGSAVRSEAVAEFARETRPVSRKTGVLSSFWSAVGRMAHA